MKKAGFIIWWCLVFAASYSGLSALEMVPVELSEANYRAVESIKAIFTSRASVLGASVVDAVDSEDTDTNRLQESVLPERVVIKKIQVDAPILNPDSRDAGVLDRALLEGVVRYPGSGGLDDESNMFLFGHSTGFRTVLNQAFKSLNHLGDLDIGDVISVYSSTEEYRYEVTSVSHVSSEEALVAFTLGEKRLTLSTCDSFGEKADRFVVEAKFIEAKPLPEASF